MNVVVGPHAPAKDEESERTVSPPAAEQTAPGWPSVPSGDASSSAVPTWRHARGTMVDHAL